MKRAQNQCLESLGAGKYFEKIKKIHVKTILRSVSDYI